MRQPLPFDKKNAEDFLGVTKSIQDAMNKIADDPRQKATIANLSKLSGVHRNTIAHRGWPKEELDKIRSERADAERNINSSESAKADRDKQEKKDLAESLKLSRDESAKWFHLYQQAIGVSEEMKRQMALLNERIASSQEELHKVRQQSKSTSNVRTLSTKQKVEK